MKSNQIKLRISVFLNLSQVLKGETQTEYFRQKDFKIYHMSKLPIE